MGREDILLSKWPNFSIRKCLTLLNMRAIKMKTWMRYYLRPVKIMDYHEDKRKQVTASKDVEKRKSLCTFDGIVN